MWYLKSLISLETNVGIGWKFLQYAKNKFLCIISKRNLGLYYSFKLPRVIQNEVILIIITKNSFLFNFRQSLPLTIRQHLPYYKCCWPHIACRRIFVTNSHFWSEMFGGKWHLRNEEIEITNDNENLFTDLAEDELTS